MNEVVQKMSGSDRPVPVWSEFGEYEQSADAAAAASPTACAAPDSRD